MLFLWGSCNVSPIQIKAPLLRPRLSDCAEVRPEPEKIIMGKAPNASKTRILNIGKMAT